MKELGSSVAVLELWLWGGEGAVGVKNFLKPN